MLVFALAAPALVAAEDPWKKVAELKTGAEVRIIKKAAGQPVLATFDELTEENVIVVVKNEQVAIGRDQIDRIDARPPQPGSRIRSESQSTVKDPDANRRLPTDSRAPRTETSSGLSMVGKPGFETVYRRTAGR
jgi:hypothetical protein